MITIDLTRTPIGADGKPTNRASITTWADDRLDIPIIAVESRNHATLVSTPDPEMVDRIMSFLSISDEAAHNNWLAEAKTWSAPAKQEMLVNPGKDAAGATGALKTFFGHLFHLAEKPMEGWQQFVVHARDERGDPVTDYLIEVLRKEDQDWVKFEEMYTDVHAYAADPSFRCFHIRLPEGISSNSIPLRVRIHASTGTELITYQGYGSTVQINLQADSEPVELDITGLGKDGKDSLFHPFTTTMIDIVLNREPMPLNTVSRIFTFLEQAQTEPASPSA
jgi:hypothetical protein